MKSSGVPSREAILKVISSPSYRPMRHEELYREFGVRGDATHAFKQLLNDMERGGELVRVKDGRYGVPRTLDLVTGKLQVHERGFGFVITAKGEEDIYIHRESMGCAMHGDTVAVRMLPPQRPRGRRGGDERREGEIAQIIERANATVVGTLQKVGKFLCVQPDNPRLLHEIYVAPSAMKGARAGQKVIVRLTEWARPNANPEGEVISILGDAGEPETDLISIIHEYSLHSAFPPAVLKEAEAGERRMGEDALRGREDLRRALTFTIDPVDARDFDDAVSLTREGPNWVLGVHIADVSHFVRPHTALDDEARARATSVYFPTRVLPMLPEALSNGVCSLRENEDRLTQSAFLTIAPDGRVIGSRFPETVIRSRKRFIYERVGALLRGEAFPEGDAEREILPVLKEMERLALILRANRFKRGALNLDMPETVIEFDARGRVSAVRREEFDNAHILIEEFMIAANETVGAHITARRAPAIWRVHDVPDDEKLYDYLELIKPFGHSIQSIHDKRAIQSFLSRVKCRPESYALQLAFLRSMKLAVYSTKNTGHYGLGSSTYLYFTSPIRRYPDLITHRLVRALREKKPLPVMDDLENLAFHCSETEQKAEEAERECIGLRKLQYLKRHMDEGSVDTLEGVITAIRDMGISVYINDYLLHGFVHISTLTDDFYKVAKNRSQMTGVRTHRRFRVGDMVTVQVARVNLQKRDVEFVIAGSEPRTEAPARRPERQPRKPQATRRGRGRRRRR
ncbi:MAG: ribonuclease R [Candidatus Aureabacteria bacterium]|nr:ribonuclease R [Candidatus Auribacterota bacterium]